MNAWQPIAPLSSEERKLDLLSMQPLYLSWRTQKARLQKESPAGLKDFTSRLVRRLSVETGILERIYDLDRGTTEALVAHGFREELISRSSTDIDPARLINILRDQENGITLVMDCVANQRKISKSVLHELHATLLRHQETTTAIDQFGNHVEIPLIKGKFKQHPNNPKRLDGTIHEYCPPVHVEAEVDMLLATLESYRDDDPVLVAAWLHHRFTQIHPYQDGNGRLARALTTLVLLKADLLPLVVDRDLRIEYIDALENADGGDLKGLAGIFARLERSAILQALSVDTDPDTSNQPTLTGAVLQSLRQKVGRRREEKDAEHRSVNDVALRLRAMAKQVLQDTTKDLREILSGIAKNPEVHVLAGGTDHKSAHWYKYEVVQSANDAGKYANFAENHYFSRATVKAGREQLVVVISFHHVGRELSGVMEATAFARLEHFENSDEKRPTAQNFALCSPEPFVFTYQSDTAKLQGEFTRWLDTAIAVALKDYGDRL
jgi:Fic family protein